MGKTKEVWVLSENNLKPVAISDVIFFEGNVNYTNLHTTEKVYVSSRTLKIYENKLDPQSFLRIHKSHIVNLQHVAKIRSTTNGGYIVLKNGRNLDISRRRYKKVKETLKILNIT